MEQQKLSFIGGGNAKWYRHVGTDSLTDRQFTKLNIPLMHDPMIALFGIYTNELKLMSLQKSVHGYLQQFYP